jgi:thioredoxin-related protein
MSKNLLWVFSLSPIFLAAQNQGISFISNLSWQEVLQKAKTENKFVFVDCYASWCGPCKIMENQVYTNDSLGAFMNEKFISVKTQMDTTNQDDEKIQHWYATADALSRQYHIEAYPTYLFFSPDGRAVHKGLGERDIQGFLAMAMAAMDENEQYYTLLAKYRHGEKNYALMPLLAQTAIDLLQDSLAIQVARDYVCHYLEMLPERKLWTKDNIQFVYDHWNAVSYGDRIFQLYHQHRKLIDSIMNEPGFADKLINYVLYRDEIKPRVDNALNRGPGPDWRRLQKEITKNYDESYANKNILQGRVEYYKSNKKWNKYIKYFIRQLEQEGIENWSPGEMNALYLNNDAYEIFKYSGDKRELEMALSWVDRALAMMTKPDPEKMDTKANILYKLSRKREGLALEERSNSLSPKNKEIHANYEKMKNGLPTWVSK